MATRTSLSPGSQVTKEKFEPESRQEPQAKDWPDLGVRPSVSQDHRGRQRGLSSQSTLADQKNGKALTCYLSPHPRTHTEPHEEGEQQRDPEGDEHNRPHGKDQAQHWG